MIKERCNCFADLAWLPAEMKRSYEHQQPTQGKQTMTIALTPAQHAILAYAHQHTEGKINWFPDHIKGGARQKVINSLFKRALITYDGKDWFVAAEGYEALGVPRKEAISSQVIDDVIEAATKATSRTRNNSKQAQVIALLQRPEGATIAQMVQATGWQKHSLRGCIAGSLKKKLGLEITSSKADGIERTYRITTN
jgi:hypothetical protein